MQTSLQSNKSKIYYWLGIFALSAALSILLTILVNFMQPSWVLVASIFIISFTGIVLLNSNAISTFSIHTPYTNGSMFLLLLLFLLLNNVFANHFIIILISSFLIFAYSFLMYKGSDHQYNRMQLYLGIFVNLSSLILFASPAPLTSDIKQVLFHNYTRILAMSNTEIALMLALSITLSIVIILLTTLKRKTLLSALYTKTIESDHSSTTVILMLSAILITFTTYSFGWLAVLFVFNCRLLRNKKIPILLQILVVLNIQTFYTIIFCLQPDIFFIIMFPLNYLILLINKILYSYLFNYLGDYPSE